LIHNFTQAILFLSENGQIYVKFDDELNYFHSYDLRDPQKEHCFYPTSPPSQ
jgi:hypothetical protein